MEDVTIAHAKEHLEELVARAAQGEEVHIVDPKLGAVKLTPIAGGAEATTSARRIPGRWKDRSRAAAWFLRSHDGRGAEGLVWG